MYQVSAFKPVGILHGCLSFYMYMYIGWNNSETIAETIGKEERRRKGTYARLRTLLTISLLCTLVHHKSALQHSHIYTHMYIHTCTYTHVHTHMYNCKCLSIDIPSCYIMSCSGGSGQNWRTNCEICGWSKWNLGVLSGRLCIPFGCTEGPTWMVCEMCNVNSLGGGVVGLLYTCCWS